MWNEPRYYLRDTVEPRAGYAGPGTAVVIYLRDRWYNCRDVATWQSDDPALEHLSVSGRRFRIRNESERLCARWNAEHDAWLASEGTASR